MISGSSCNNEDWSNDGNSALITGINNFIIFRKDRYLFNIYKKKTEKLF